MKRLLLLIALGFAGYIAWPMWTAYEIYRATRDGDQRALEARVDWESLRASLKSTLRAEVADQTVRRLGRSRLVERVSLGLQQIAGWRVIERRLEDLATPAGLIAFDAARRDKARRLGEEPPRDLNGIYRRLNERVRRIAFVSPTRVEFEVADRFDPLRRVRSVLELRAGTWKLTELAILRTEQ